MDFKRADMLKRLLKKTRKTQERGRQNKHDEYEKLEIQGIKKLEQLIIDLPATESLTFSDYNHIKIQSHKPDKEIPSPFASREEFRLAVHRLMSQERSNVGHEQLDLAGNQYVTFYDEKNHLEIVYAAQPMEAHIFLLIRKYCCENEQEKIDIFDNFYTERRKSTV